MHPLSGILRMWVGYTRFYRQVYLRHYLGNNNRIIAFAYHVCAPRGLNEGYGDGFPLGRWYPLSSVVQYQRYLLIANL